MVLSLQNIFGWREHQDHLRCKMYHVQFRNRLLYYLPPTSEEVYVFVHTPGFICLSVCKITQKCMHGFGWNVACRQMSGHGRTDQLLSPIRIIVRMLELDSFLPLTQQCGILLSGKYHARTRIGGLSKQQRVVLRRRKTVVGGKCTLLSALLVLLTSLLY